MPFLSFIRRPVFLSLRAKIILLTCLMPLLALCLVGGFAYWRMTDLTVKTSLLGFAAETRLMAQRVEASYDEIKNDAYVAAHTPPIRGFIRSEKAKGIDPLDGSSLLQWKERLETIFVSIMEAKPYYLDISYISVGKEGRDRVRVTRKGQELEASKEAALQNNGDMPFYQSSVTLPKDTFFVSDITDEEPPGSPNHTAVFYTVFPIYDAEQLAGLIVITTDYEALHRKTFQNISSAQDIYLVNHRGDYIAKSKNQFISSLSRPGADKIADTLPFIKEAIQTNDHEHTFIEDDKISYLVKLFPDAINKKSFLGVILQTSKQDLLKSTVQVQKNILTLLSVILLACLIVSVLISRRLTKPLKEMALALNKLSCCQKADFPMTRHDEIGDLARVLQNTLDKLHDEENSAEVIFNSAFDGLLTVNASGEILRINPACSKLFGYAPDKLIGKTIDKIMPPQEAKLLYHYLQTNNHNGLSVFEHEIIGIKNDGTTFPVDLSLTRTLQGTSHVFAGVLRDATMRKKKESLKDAFASTVNNQLRLPLTNIRDTLADIKDWTSSRLDDKGRRLVNFAYDNCARLSDFLDDVLDIEKIASGKMYYVLRETNICPLIHHIVETQQDFAETNKVALAIDGVCTRALCQIDGPRFMQAFINILSNAIKFSPDGETVTIKIQQEDDSIRLSVIDHGPGIPVSFQNRVFEKFAQAEESTAKAQGGSGLGLYLAKTILEAFNGRLSFETEEGKGSAFHIDLPLVLSKENEAA